MEENKPIGNEEVEQSEVPTSSGKLNPPNNEPPLNPPSTDESIVPAEATPEVEQPQTINYKPQTEEMEVHHHTHASHRKKNWKSYFWEFLMLFLAVFCGFLAEYQLEHKIERDRAKELAKSFYLELKNDSITAGTKVQNRLKQEDALKYLVVYFKDSSLTNVSKQFALNFIYGVSFRSPSIFEPRTIVLEQLRNSGALRYFKNDAFQTLTGDLTVAIKNIYDRQEVENKTRNDYITPLQMKHLDFAFDDEMKKGGKTIFEGVTNYEKSNEIIPYNLNEPDKIDRQFTVRILAHFSGNVLSSTRTTHIKKYQEINSNLLKLLRAEYHFN